MKGTAAADGRARGRFSGYTQPLCSGAASSEQSRVTNRQPGGGFVAVDDGSEGAVVRRRVPLPPQARRRHTSAAIARPSPVSDGIRCPGPGLTGHRRGASPSVLRYPGTWRRSAPAVGALSPGYPAADQGYPDKLAGSGSPGVQVVRPLRGEQSPTCAKSAQPRC